MIKLLIVGGTILLLIGVIGMLVLELAPAIKDGIFLITGKERKENIFTKKKKKRAASRLLKKFRTISILGAGFLIIGLFLKYIPRGQDSFFSENVDGISVGDGDIISENEEDKDKNNLEEYADNSALDTNTTDNSVYIVIEGNDISFGNTAFNDLEEFVDYFNSFDSLNKKVYLVDKYAVSKTYHDVSESLGALGIEYEERKE